MEQVFCASHSLSAPLLLLLLEFGVKWQNTWTSAALERMRVFSYRGSPKTELPETDAGLRNGRRGRMTLTV